MLTEDPNESIAGLGHGFMRCQLTLCAQPVRQTSPACCPRILRSIPRLVSMRTASFCFVKHASAESIVCARLKPLASQMEFRPCGALATQPRLLGVDSKLVVCCPGRAGA